MSSGHSFCDRNLGFADTFSGLYSYIVQYIYSSYMQGLLQELVHSLRLVSFTR